MCARRPGLARLSLSNQLLVAMARPDATFVAGFKGWLRLGYAVNKGEKAIRIIAPLPVERDRATGEQTGETRVLFKTVFVFDRAQVAPIDGADQAPLQPPCEPLSGDSYSHLIAPMQAFAESLGFTVTFEAIDGPAGGWCDQRAPVSVHGAVRDRHPRLDFAHRLISVEDAKTEAGIRKVDLSPMLLDELLAWRASLPDPTPESPFFPREPATAARRTTSTRA